MRQAASVDRISDWNFTIFNHFNDWSHQNIFNSSQIALASWREDFWILRIKTPHLKKSLQFFKNCRWVDFLQALNFNYLPRHVNKNIVLESSCQKFSESINQHSKNMYFAKKEKKARNFFYMGHARIHVLRNNIAFTSEMKDCGNIWRL